MDKDWLAQAVFREASEAIVACDPGGTIAAWNGGAERVFGYPAAEAVGQSLDLIIPEKQRARHWAGYEKTMATGETKYGETLLKVPATHRDGRRLSIEFSVALLRDADGKIAGIAAVIRDTTERWAAERELRQRLAEAERRVRELEGQADAAGAPAE
ncbi:MAG TPA: PAS domain S-box protein [Trebonia sp.]|nr:PAS domain S-box protein [Trebonia sp.]